MIRDLFKIPILEANLNVDLKTLKKHCLKIKKSYFARFRAAQKNRWERYI